MDEVTRLGRCPRCGTDLPPHTPEELCSTCLLAEAGLSSGTGLSDDAETQLSPKTSSGGAADGPRLMPGQTFGPYCIERLLGRGGMGEVYAAEHLEHGRRIALKVLSQRLADAKDRARFLREGQLAASINHPNSVYIFGSEEIAGTPVIAMELLPGGTLKDLVTERGPLAPAVAADAILQLIAGLDAAHAAGILHRDIKPSNCFVDRDGTVKVGDFGLSISTLAREATVSMSGTFQGTPHFAAPEQLRGEPLDVRADIYAVGATLYYLLTGRPPFDERDLMTLLTKVATEVPASPRTLQNKIPHELAAIVLRCLAKDKTKRPASYAELGDALRPFGSAAPTPATLGLRFMAGAIDMVLLTVVNLTLAFIGSKLLEGVTPTPFTPTDQRMLALAAVGYFTLTRVIYFGLLEGVWRASVGKRLCGLSVTRAGSGERVGVWLAGVRAVIYWLPIDLPYLVTLIVSFMSGTSLDPLRATLASWLSYPLFAALFASCRRRNGFAAVHDLVTGTRVVERSRSTARASIAEAVVPEHVSARKCGPYDVLGRLGDTESGTLLVGFDPTLRRKVWLHELPPGALPVAQSRRELGRPGRLRWLAGARTPGAAWDAYEAVDGAPLRAVAWAGQPVGIVKRWLVELAREVEAGVSEAPAFGLSLDRVWITRTNEPKVIDFGIGGDRQAPMDSAQRLLALVGHTALGGRADAEPGDIDRALPIGLRAALRSLSHDAFASISAARQALEAQLLCADRIAGWQRVGTLLLPGLLFLVSSFAMAFAGPLLQQRVGGPEAELAFWLDQRQVWAGLPFRSGPGQEDLRRLGDAQAKAVRQKLEAVDTYIAGRYGSLISTPAFWTTEEAGAIQSQRALAEQILAARPIVSGEELARVEGELRDMIDRLKEKQQAVRQRRIGLYLLVIPAFLFSTVIASGLAVLTAFASRGGLLFRWWGVAVTSADGTTVPRWRAAWRAIIAWSPPALAYLVVFNVTLEPAVEGIIAAIGLMLLPLGAAWAVFQPERGLQDRLAGTWLVPR